MGVKFAANSRSLPNALGEGSLDTWFPRMGAAMVRFVLGVFACVFVLNASPAMAKDAPRGEAAFTDYVAEKIRRELGVAVTIKGPLTLGIGTMQGNLDRIYGFCGANPAGCGSEIANYVKAIAEATKTATTPPAKQNVRLIVRTKAYIESARQQLRRDKMEARPLAGELVIVPALDMPRTLRSMTAKDAQDLGLPMDKVYELGRSNLSRTLKPLMKETQAVRSGQIGYIEGDPYHSSRLALHDSWAPLAKAQGGRLIVAAPATNLIVFISDDTPVAIDAFHTVATQLVRQASNPLSAQLLRWTPKGWEAAR
jgi:hypothetical protein